MMLRRPLGAIAILVGIWTLPLRAEETGEPRFLLEVRYPAGDTIRLEGEVRGKVALVSGESAPPASAFEIHHRYAIEERILRVDAGEVVEKTRFYERWEEGLQIGGLDVRDSDATYLHGRTLRFTKSEGEVEVEGVGAPIKDSKRESLKAHFDYLALPYPEHPVALGESWETEGLSLVPAAGLAGKIRIRFAKIRCRLEAVESAGKGRIARISIEAEVEGQLPELKMLALRGKAQGLLMHDLDAARPIRLEATVRLEGSGLELGGEKPARLRCEGDLEIEAAWTRPEDDAE